MAEVKNGRVITDRALRARDVAFLAVLVIAAAALRLYKLETGLWYDEIVTLLESVRPPLREIVSHFPGDNNHPLYSVLAHFSVSLFGESPWALRLPSALFGIASIPALYLLGTVATNRLEAGAAASILTVSYHHIWFSQNARGYTLLLFCVVVATLALIRWFDTGRRAFLVLYAIATAAGAYAHLTMVLVSLSHAAACAVDALARGRTSRARAEAPALAKAFAGSAALTLLCYAPTLPAVGVVFAVEADASSAASAAAPVWTALMSALSGLQVGFGALWGIVIGGAIFVAGAWSYFRQRPLVILLFLLPLVATVLVPLAMQRPIRPRFVFFAIGFGLLVIVRGAAWIGAAVARRADPAVQPHRGAQLAVALVTLAAVALSVRSLPYGYRYPKQDYAQAVSLVERLKSPRDAVAVVGDGGTIPVVKYLGRSWQRVDHESSLRAMGVRGERVWVVYTFPSAIETGSPGLWTMLQNECTVAGEFEGTVADGTITVRRCP